METSDPREPDRGFAEPDGLAYDPGTPRWNTLGNPDEPHPLAVPDQTATEQPGEPDVSNPGPRRAAFGVILATMALVVGVLAQLAGFVIVVWLAIPGFAIAGIMIGQGYRQWRVDAEG